MTRPSENPKFIAVVKRAVTEGCDWTGVVERIVAADLKDSSGATFKCRDGGVVARICAAHCNGEWPAGTPP